MNKFAKYFFAFLCELILVNSAQGKDLLKILSYETISCSIVKSDIDFIIKLSLKNISNESVRIRVAGKDDGIISYNSYQFDMKDKFPFVFNQPIYHRTNNPLERLQTVNGGESIVVHMRLGAIRQEVTGSHFEYTEEYLKLPNDIAASITIFDDNNSRILTDEIILRTKGHEKCEGVIFYPVNFYQNNNS